MRPGLPFIAAIALLAAACEIGVPVTIEVQSSRRVLFTIPEEHARSFCLVSATIYRLAEGREDAVWRIGLRRNAAAGPCRLSFAYPQPPPGFIAEIGSDHLEPGSYRVRIDGGLPQATGDFTMP